MLFSACQKEELKTGEDSDVILETKPDVYLENDYLVFKNMDAVDSVIQDLNQMTRQEKDVWEQQIGFKSARAGFEKLFDEYETLSSKEEFLAFKKKYSAQLKFNEMDETDCSIDYPYACTYYASVMNSNGVFKVGLSLFKYTRDNQIIVLDGDLNKLKNIAEFAEDKNVIISTNLKSTAEYKSESVLLHDFPEFDPSGRGDRWWLNYGYGSDRKLLNELKVVNWVYWETVRVYDNPLSLSKTTVTKGYRVYLRQYGLKKGTFGWNTYYTTYVCQNLECQIDGGSKFSVTGAISVSPEVKPEYNWAIKSFEYTSVYSYSSGDISYLSNPTVKMEADLSCRGFDGRLTHVYYNLPFWETY